MALSDASPTTAAFFRSLYALPVLVVLATMSRRGGSPIPPRVRHLSFIAGMSLGVSFATWHESIERIGAGLGTAIGNIQVVLVGVVAWVLLRESPRRVTLFTMPLIAAGLVLVAGVGSANPHGEDPVGGAVFGILTGVFYAGFLLIFRGSVQKSPTTVGPLRDATAGALLASILLVPFDGAFSLSVTWPGHGWLLALGLGSQVVGWLLIARTMPQLQALETSVTLLLQPALSLLWGAWILGERLAGLQWVGVVFVGIGIVVVSGSGANATNPVRSDALEPNRWRSAAREDRGRRRQSIPRE